MRGWAVGIVASVVALAPAPAVAQLAIDRLWVDFEPGTPSRADVVIRNESKDRYYITVVPVEIVGPGSADEKRVSIADPEQLGLLVTPNRLVLDPGSLRSIRLVSLNGDLKADRVYRVKIAPQVGAIDAADVGSDNRGVAIKVLAAYDVLVTVRPKAPKPDLVATRTATELTIRNDGNSNALLFDGELCPAGNAAGGADKACSQIGSRRIYPGNDWKIVLKSPGDKVSFKQKISASFVTRQVVF